MADEPTFLFVAAYDAREDAQLDFDGIRRLHATGLLGTCDAALVTKSAGKVHVHEQPAQRGAWSGLAVGALLGVLFPSTVLAAGVAGATMGGLVGHFWRGMSRSAVREIGTLLDAGEAAVIVIGVSEIEGDVAKALRHAQRRITEQIDAAASDLDQELAAAGQAQRR